MQTRDIGQLRQDAVEKIIFHATPKKWLIAVSEVGSRTLMAALRALVPRSRRRPTNAATRISGRGTLREASPGIRPLVRADVTSPSAGVHAGFEI
jgi:hypothetical protein